MRILAAVVWTLLATQGAVAQDSKKLSFVPRPVVTEKITATPEASNTFIGFVGARVQTDLGFPMIGTIAGRPVDIGDIVAKGDMLARLDPQDMQADLRAAQAGVSVASAHLQSARDAEYRLHELVGRGVESQTSLDAATLTLKAAKAELEQAEASVVRAKDIVGYAILNAPQNGVITQTYAEPGATLDAGQPVVRLVGTEQREVVIDVSEQDLAAIDANSSFDVALIANPDIVARVTLSRIDPVINRSTRTRRVRLALTDPPASFRLGALVRILPATGTKAAISIPQSAIIDPEGDAPSVWVVDRTDNTVSRRQVVMGARFGQRIRIDDGLAIGDEVVLKGIHSLEKGQIVGLQVMP